MGKRHFKNKRKNKEQDNIQYNELNNQLDDIEIEEITDDWYGVKTEEQEVKIEEHNEKVEEQEIETTEQSIKEKEIELIDINQDYHTCRGRRLTPEQTLNLINIKNRANDKANKTLKILQAKNIIALRDKFREFRKLFTAATKDKNKVIMLFETTFVTTVVFIVTLQLLALYIKENSPSINNNANTIINISMDNETNTLSYDLEEISVIDKHNINLGMNRLGWLKGDVNTFSTEYTINNETYTLSSQTLLSSLSVQPNQVYVEYKNSEGTASKELIFASTKPEQINTKQLKKLNRHIREKVNSVQVQTTLSSYHDSFIMMIETVAGGQLNTKTQKPQILGLEESIVLSNNQDNIIIRLDELGDINTYKIEEISESPSITYNKNEDVLRIGNSAENIDYIYIFGINNNTMKVNAEDLLATNYDNIYMTVGYNDPDNNAFRTLIISTDTNIYCIKFNGLADESLRKNVFEQLGIKLNEEIKINTIQKFVEAQ